MSQSVQAALTASIPSLMDAVERRVDAAVQRQLAHSGPPAPQSSTPNPTSVASVPNPPASTTPGPTTGITLTPTSPSLTLTSGSLLPNSSQGMLTMSHVPLFSLGAPTFSTSLVGSLSAPMSSTTTNGSIVSQLPAPLSNLHTQLGVPGDVTVTVGQNAVTVSEKIVKKSLRGEYIDMCEFLPDTLGTVSSPVKGGSADNTLARKKKRKIRTILQWVECFNAFISLVSNSEPNRVPDLLAYSSLIVHAARKFEGDGWQVYDRNFRRAATNKPHLKWGEIHTTFWSLAFVNAKPREHCSLCLSINHTTTECDEYDPPKVSPTPNPKRPAQSNICRNWNFGTCP